MGCTFTPTCGRPDLPACSRVGCASGSAGTGLRPGVSVLAGVAECFYCDVNNGSDSALFAELGIPLGTRFQLLAFGLTGEGEAHALGAGMRARF